jgi:DNA-binding response OmpR family regulator
MDHSGVRILLSESDPVLLMAVADDLRGAGFEVLEAKDGIEALNLLDYPDDIDLVVTSLGTAGADGMEVARRARTHGSPVPVVFASGRHDLSEAEAQPPARSQRLSKPFTSAALREAINNLLERPFT